MVLWPILNSQLENLRLRSKLAKARCALDEGLLAEILSNGGLANHTHDDAEEGTAIPVDQLAESLLGPLQTGLNQVCVATLRHSISPAKARCSVAAFTSNPAKFVRHRTGLAYSHRVAHAAPNTHGGATWWKFRHEVSPTPLQTGRRRCASAASPGCQYPLR